MASTPGAELVPLANMGMERPPAPAPRAAPDHVGTLLEPALPPSPSNEPNRFRSSASSKQKDGLGTIGLGGGGRSGIRTHGTLAGTPVFKTGALNHSATLPSSELLSLNAVDGAWQREVGARPFPGIGSVRRASACSLTLCPLGDPGHWRHLPGRRRLRGPVWSRLRFRASFAGCKEKRRPRWERRLNSS